MSWYLFLGFQKVKNASEFKYGTLILKFWTHWKFILRIACQCIHAGPRKISRLVV